MSLAEAADVDVEADVLRHRFSALVTADVVLPNVSGRVAVFFHRLGDRDGFGGDILGLLRRDEGGGFPGEALLRVVVETAQIINDVDVVVDPGGILTREHRGAGRGAVGLRVGVGEAEPFGREFLEMGRAVVFAVRAHRRGVCTDVVPSEVIDHVDDNVGLFGGQGCSGEYAKQTDERDKGK